MNPLFQWLAQLFRPKPLTPDGPGAGTGDPHVDLDESGNPAPPKPVKPAGSLIGVGGKPAVVGGAAPAGPTRSPELDELMGDYRKQRDVLMKEPSSAEINPIEAAVSGLIGLTSKSPMVKQKAFGAPAANAESDAATANAGLGQQQSAASAMMGHTGSLIKAYLDRDTQADKITELISTATMKDATTRLIAGWRQNVQLTQALTKYVAGDGNPMFQPTAQGVGTILQQQALAQGINMSDADAQTAGQQWIQNLQPSDITKMRMAAQQAQQEHFKDEDATSRMKELSGRMRYETDPAAMRDLRIQEWQAANPGVYLDPATRQSIIQSAMLDAQMNHASQQGKIDLDVKRGNAAVSAGNLSDARAASETVRAKHLGHLMDAQATKAESEAHKANVAAGQLTGVGPNGKPITGTARFNAMNSVTSAQIKSNRQVAYWTGLADQLSAEAHDPNHVYIGKDGNKIEDTDQLTAAREALQNQAAAAAMMRDSWKLESKQRAAQLAGLQNPPAPHANALAGLTDRIGQSVDLGGGITATKTKGG